jgi:hypothetical protein
MGKKVYISLLSLIFFVSTTALPYTIHACRMMENNSDKVCSMCDKASNHSASAESQNIKNDGAACCSSKLVDSSVKENFLQNSGSVKDFTQLKYIAPAILVPDLLISASAGIMENNVHAPPLINNNPVYLINSIFLI